MAILIGSGVSQGSSTAVGGIPNLPFTGGPGPISLAGAQAFIIPPGPHFINPGQYSSVQTYDSVLQQWRQAQYPHVQPCLVPSDGSNFRLINTTGCPTGAIITNKGSGYTNGIGTPTAVINTGGSLWTCITGGSINTTLIATTAGKYNYKPTLVFSAPPQGGVRATAVATLTGGGLDVGVVTNAGAGYTTAPTITIVPDPRETGTQGGVLTVNATLANSGSITAVICTDPGTTAQTSTPTLTFSGGGGSAAAATVLMNYTVTGFTVGTAGAVYGNAQPFLVMSGSGVSTASLASGIVDPILDTGISISRQAIIGGTSTAGGAVTATGIVIVDGGWGFQRIPDLYVFPSGTGALPTTTAIVTATVGATTDTCFVQRIGN